MGDDREIPNFESLSPEEKKALVKALLQGDKKVQERLNETEDEISLGSKLLALIGLPVEANPRELSSFPIATIGLIAFTAMTSLYCLFVDPEMANRLSFFPADPLRLGGLAFLTCFFVHGGLVHLLSNLYCLFVFGDNVEDDLGVFWYLTLLTFATFTGSLLSGMFSPGQEMIPHVGASGGIMGVMVYYLLRFPKAKFTYLFLFRFIRVPAAFVLFFFVFLDFIGAFEQVSGLGEVDHLAHLGGGLAGLVFWLLWRISARQRPQPGQDEMN